MIEGKKQMKILTLVLITLSLIACGEIDEDNDTCNVFDANYSHTITRCNDRIVAVEILCDYRGIHDRDMCVTADQLPELAGNCGHFNQCWRE